MKRLHYITFAFPFAFAFACGGEVFLDGPQGPSNDASSDAPPFSSDAAATVVCGMVPEVVATVDVLVPSVNKIVVTNTHAVYMSSNPKGQAQRALHAVDLATKGDVLLAGGGARMPDDASFAVVGSVVYYISDLLEGKDAHACVVMTSLSGETRDCAFYPSADTFANLSSLSDGSLYGTCTRPVGGAKDSAWLVKPTGSLPAESDLLSFSAVDSLGALTSLSVFHGGFVGIDTAFKNVRMGFGDPPVVGPVLSHADYSYREATVFPRTSATPSNILWLGSSAGGAEEVRRTACTFPVGGAPVCDHAGSALVYQVPAAGSRHLANLDVMNSGAAVIVQRDEAGVRPTAQVLLLRGDAAEPVGGEGLTGTVDAITAVTTHGNCIYWAEEGTTGTRIMRVGR